jgi:hypothetical protein
MKTAELTGNALDWAVAKCELMNGADYTLEVDKDVDGKLRINFGGMYPEWSTDWSEGGTIIERERMQITPRGETTDLWEAIMFDNIFMDDGSDCFQTGTTPLIAAMRCYVASKLGEEVDIPQELTQ